MFKSFYELFNWYEYIVKADWIPNGQYFWVHIYDRLQMHMATVFIPLDFFVYEDLNEPMDLQTSTYAENLSAKNVLLIAEQTSNSWINVKISFYC